MKVTRYPISTYYTNDKASLVIERGFGRKTSKQQPLITFLIGGWQSASVFTTRQEAVKILRDMRKEQKTS